MRDLLTISVVGVEVLAGRAIAWKDSRDDSVWISRVSVLPRSGVAVWVD